MIATYTGAKTLNVREEPDSRAAIVRKLAAGESSPCRAVTRGWAELDGGWADARFLDIRDDPTEAEQPDAEPEAVEVAEREPEPVAEAPEAEPEPAEQPDVEPVLDDAYLQTLTVPELRELAAGSGIPIRSKAVKDEIIATILAHD